MKKITVVIVGSVYHQLMRFSIESTLRATPDVEEIITVSDKPVYDTAKFIELRNNFNRHDYADFVLKQLWPIVKTEFILLVQYDGMAVNSQHWTDDFYNYDYIGSPWPDHFGWLGQNELVGNGGFSLRSARLLEALRDTAIQRGSSHRNDNEDAVICQQYRSYLETQHQIKYAPLDLANLFGHEWRNPTGNTFGFHGHFNVPLYFDDDTTAQFVETIRLPWYNDQLQFFLEICEKKNYLKSLNILNKKLSDFLNSQHT